MRSFVITGAIALASALPAASAEAQSLPNVSGIKQTTTRAVDKTNAHTIAMTNVDSIANAASAAKAAAPTGAAAGAAATKRPAEAEKASGVRATAAGNAARAAVADTAGKIVLRREVFAYDQSGRRDPFVSLMTVGELRPMISDLVITGILIDASGKNSIAILRDVTSKEQYRVRVGQQIGRMRVARIAQKAVTFTIEEFGYSRQQELAMEDSNQARTK